jgi:hypothetical protein
MHNLGVEDITRSKHRLKGDYCFNNVGTKLSELPVNRAVRAYKREEATFDASVVVGGGGPGKGNRNRHGCDVHDVDHGR